MTPNLAASAAEHELPFTPWRQFMDGWRWSQGEHVTVIGPTGTGKTTLIRAIMPKRYDAGGAVAVLATKPADAGLDAWARTDRLTVVRDWPPRKWPQPRDVLTSSGKRLRWDRRVMVWPRVKGLPLSQIDAHVADVHRRALTAMFWQTSWCVVAEELMELTRIGLASELEQMWSQGRSAKLTLVGATQRPVDIPLLAYSSASHLFMFADNDEVNLRRMQGIGGMSGAQLRGLVASLPQHDVLYIGTRTRELIRTRVPVRKAGNP